MTNIKESVENEFLSVPATEFTDSATGGMSESREIIIQPRKIISPPTKTPEMLYNRMAIIYFGILFFFFGYFMVISQPVSSWNTIGVLFYIIAFFLYYFLLIDFVLHFVIKVFGIVYSNYQQNRGLYYLVGIFVFIVLCFGAVVNFVPPTSIFYGPSFIAMTLACGFIVDLTKPLYLPYVQKFYDRYLKKSVGKYKSPQ
jgi:hypothetical protein